MRQSDATARQNVATIGDTAKALGVSVRTIQRRIERGQMNVSERDGKRFVELASVAQATATVDATPRQSVATERDSDRREMEAELRAQLAREREFSAILKAQIEDSNRNAAELRAALRKALDITPKQLTTGTPEPIERGEIGGANNVPSVTMDAVKSPANRRGDGLKSVRDGLRQMFMRK